MRVFKSYDLKDGTEKHIMCEEMEEDEHPIRDIVLSTMKALCKIVIPAIIAFTIYLFLADRLYEIRGYYGVGSEIFLPLLIWYAGYRFMERLF